MTLLNLAPAGIATLLALAAFFCTFHQQRSLRLPKFYFAFVAMADMLGVALWLFWPLQYDSIFWIFEISNDIFFCLMSLELLRRFLPPRFVILWLYSSLLVTITLFPAHEISTIARFLFSASISACLTSGALLVLLPFMPRVHWTFEEKMVAAGVVLGMLSSLLPLLAARPYFADSLQKVGGWATIIVSGAQIMQPISLVLLSAAGRFKTQSRRAHAS